MMCIIRLTHPTEGVTYFVRAAVPSKLPSRATRFTRSQALTALKENEFLKVAKSMFRWEPEIILAPEN